jgi:hypothetical protein
MVLHQFPFFLQVITTVYMYSQGFTAHQTVPAWFLRTPLSQALLSAFHRQRPLGSLWHASQRPAPPHADTSLL